MELVATMPKPEGFFDPKAPAGSVRRAATAARAAPDAAPPRRQHPPPPAPRRRRAAPQRRPRRRRRAAAARSRGRLDFANSDLAFRRADMFVGNFNGFNTYDIETPKKPRLLASVVCPGGQGDMSVHGNLLFMSVEQTRGRVDCGTQGVTDTASAERFRGVRIFDISDISKPKQVAAVQTCRGSHTHTLVDRSEGHGQHLHLRLGHRLRCARARSSPDARAGDPNEDPNTALFSIDVIKVPLAAPQKATIVNRPRIFADEKTGAIAGLETGRRSRRPARRRRAITNQCHDITVYPGGRPRRRRLLRQRHPARHLGSGAPGPARRRVDKNFAYWHSATFNNDGTKVIFTDEWGGGTAPRCRATDQLDWGADAIFDIVDKKLEFTRLLQDAGGADRPGELRRAQRLADPGARPRHHGPGLVSGRPLGVRLHRFGASGGDRLLRSRSARRART